MYEEIKEAAQARFDINEKLVEVLIEELDLPLTASQIDFDQPLFGRGLELDSLDTLGIVSGIEDEFEVYLSDEDRHVFGSVNTLADGIMNADDAENANDAVDEGGN